MNQRHGRSNLAHVILVLLALAIAACGGGGDDAAVETKGSSASPPGGQAAGGANTGQPARGNVMDGSQSTSSGAPNSVVGEAAQTSGKQAESGAASAPPAAEDYDRVVIRSGTIGLQAKDVGKAIGDVRHVAATNGGFISESNRRQERDSLVADLTVTVPSANFEKAYEALGGIGKVVSGTSDSSDVTEEFVDLQARQRHLEATETSLIALLDKATNMEEILTVRRELGTVQAQLEQVKGRARYLSSRATMSTISVSLRPLPVPQTAANPKPNPAASWSAFDVAARAWNASLRMLQAVATVVISILVFGWWLLPVLLAALVWWRRGGRARRPQAPGTSSVGTVSS